MVVLSLVLRPKIGSHGVHHITNADVFELNTEQKPLAYLDILIETCGALCQADNGSFTDSLFFNKRVVNVDCSVIFDKSVFIHMGHGFASAPAVIPKLYLSDYTLDGRILVKTSYFNQQYVSKTAAMNVWHREQVVEWTTAARIGELEGNYGRTVTAQLRDALDFAHGVRGGRVLVIGSENPWVEATALSVGAKSIVTLEYGSIVSKHPEIKTMTPREFREKFKIGQLGMFDAIITFSSVEHSGLGRYGDVLNPWGDVLEIARAHCVCKTGGSLIIGVPTSDTNDMLVFNAHRVYGKIRWPYLATNWEQVYRANSSVSADSWDQRVHVFSKI